MKAWIAGLILCAACTPPLPGPVIPDSATDGGCAFAEKFNEARLIRVPDGASLFIPCSDAGAP